MNLFTRHPENPILTAEQWPYPVHAVFNPGAVRLDNGKTLLLVRCEDFRGISHLTTAVSENGVDGWHISDRPTLTPDATNFPEEMWGIEDARVTWVPDFGQFIVAYTAFGEGGPGVALALTKDFVNFKRRGLVMSPDDKDAALFPRRFKDGFALIHRPVTSERADIWISFSPDLKHWGQSKLVVKARRGAWWDANKIGLSPPPIETPEGWLILYHGVRRHASGSLYRVGALLLDLDDPTKLIRRGQDWIFGPSEPYERIGDVPNVVFPTGFTCDGDQLNLYYGCADSSIGLATASLKSLTSWLMNNGSMDSYLEEEAVIQTDVPGQSHSADERATSENIEDPSLQASQMSNHVQG
jgi:predicted GH43/DUF377 family glycosyl hydrolase